MEKGNKKAAEDLFGRLDAGESVEIKEVDMLFENITKEHKRDE